MGTHATRRPSTLGNIPMDFAPILYSDPSYFEASRAPISAPQADGVSFIAKLGRVLRARG